MRRRRDDDERRLSIREAAAYLGIPRREILGLVRSGRLPFVRSGRRTRLTRRELERLAPRGTSGTFLRGIAVGALAAAFLALARGSRARRSRNGGSPPRLAVGRGDYARRQQLLAEFLGLLDGHYATTRFIAALLVLNNRRKKDRRVVDIPVAVDRRSGKDRRASPNLDAEVDRWRRRVMAQ